MGRRVLNRKELRADYDAAERQKPNEDEVDEVEEEVDDEADEEEEEGEAAEGEEEAGEDDEEEGEDEEAPKKKKKVVKVAKPKAKPRTRTPKVTRMKVIWGVFNNSNQRVATFDYPKRKDADDLAVKLTADKKNTHFVQPIKEPIEEKKE